MWGGGSCRRHMGVVAEGEGEEESPTIGKVAAVRPVVAEVRVGLDVLFEGSCSRVG